MDIHAGRTFDSSPNDDDDDNDGDIYRDSLALDDTATHGAHLRPGMARSRVFTSVSEVGVGSMGGGIGSGVGGGGGGVGGVGGGGVGGGMGSAGVGGVPLGPGGTVRGILRFFVRALSRGGHASYRELSSLGASGGGGVGNSNSNGAHANGGGQMHMLPLSEDEYEVDYDTGSVLSSCMGAFRLMLLSSWLNALLVFVPIGMVTYLTHMKPIAVFTTNAIAVIPLSSLLTAATERVASDAGDTVGALLNISLGNLVELILFIVALVNNQVRVVQASILGSILVNSLLILGTALLATGLTDNEPGYNTAETQLLSCLLFASVFVFLMPTAFGYTFDHSQQASKATLQMSRVSSLMVLLIYLIYFVHELRSRPIAEVAAKDPESDADASDDSSDGFEYNGERLLITPTTPTVATAPVAVPAGMTMASSTAIASPPLSTSGGMPEVQQVATASGVVINHTHTHSHGHGHGHGHNRNNSSDNTGGLPHPRSVRFAEAPPARPTSRHGTSFNGGGGGGGIELERMDSLDGTPFHTHRSSTRMHSHTRSRSVSVDSMRAGRRSRASSLSAGSIGGGSSSSNMAGLSSLGGPGLMRSGLTALHIMRDNQQAHAQQQQQAQAQRMSMESSISGADHASLLGADPLLPASLAMSGVVPGQLRKRPRGEFMMAVVVLIVASALMSVNAEFLVDTIDDVTHQGHLSESVIGLIILPIVGNIAEYVTVVSVALRDKLDLAISVAIGSSIQIALCVTPLTVGAGWILNRNMSLTFSFFEMAALVGTALLVGLLVSSNGDSKLRTCGLKGALMCACYVIIG